MNKWMRNYKAIFEIGEKTADNKYYPKEEITIQYPITLELYIEVGSYSSANKGIFNFYNLSREIESKLWLDNYEAGNKYVHMKLYAGYGSNLTLVYDGEVLECTTSQASGSVDRITNIQSYISKDFYQFGYLNATFTKGTSLTDILNIISKTNPNIKIGYITPDIPPLPRDRTFIGQTINLLRKNYQGYKIFIDKGELNILGDRDVVPGEVQVITDSVGLLGSPRRANLYTEIDSLFEPQLTTGQALTVLSNSLPQFNQTYEVIKIIHKGIISGTQCGSLITTTTLSFFPTNYRELKKQPPTTYAGKPTQGKWDKPVQGRVSSPFGLRKSPKTGASTNHKGMDIAAPLNTVVYAPANGKIIGAYISGSLTKDYGRLIKIDHGKIDGKTVTSLYGHLNQWLVTSGQTVSKGDAIALVGSSGNSTGPHLHFEIKEDGTAVNPTKYIGTYG